MRPFNLNIKKIATSIVLVCLLISVTGFISIPIIEKVEFVKSSHLFENYLNNVNEGGEEKDNEESNETFDYFTHSNFVLLSHDFLAEKVDFLYSITGKVNNYIDIHCPPPKC